jgi:hypothetical protein
LIKKLNAYGIRGDLLLWVEDFLKDRKQRVTLGHGFSDWINITSGVPQGSVLGPLLFLIYINDLPDMISSCIKLFADDTKLYRIVQTQEQTDMLQSDLTRLAEWSNVWQMEFNIDKCSVIHLGSHGQGSDYYVVRNGVNCPLRATEAERDLGIVIDSHLSFERHIEIIVNKANRQLGLIKRSFAIRDSASMLNLYKSTVRPILEYGSPVWDPWKAKYIDRIESVQRRFTKLVYGMRDLSYEERLRRLKLPTLFFRRRRERLIQTFKILHQLYDVDSGIFFNRSCSNTRGHEFKLQTARSRLTCRSNFFSVHVVNDWNSLPADVVMSQTLNQFKARLGRFLISQQFTLREVKRI